ncbi:YeaC family protein [Oceanisphaera sp. W20_SRM_FM3]|uniref:YeaC family protein n=1 Tax=Oceanisphaera sp. W20_SRM_FM3 TaxID=3240267 RepID=UPI003F9B6826
MSSFEQVIANMPEEVFQRLKTAVEIGKWPDGIVLTAEQKESSLQAVLMWQALHVDNPEHMSVGKGGDIMMKSKAELLRQYSDEIEIARQKVD